MSLRGPICLGCHEKAKTVLFACATKAHKVLEWSHYRQRIADGEVLAAPKDQEACRTCKGAVYDVDFTTWINMVANLQKARAPQTKCENEGDSENAEE